MILFLRKHPVAVGVAALILGHVCLLGYGIRSNFVVVDEVGHLGSGLAHWETGQFSPYSVNPPLPRMLAALPVWASGAAIDYSRVPMSSRPEWTLGKELARGNGERYFDLACLARLSGLFWSLLGAWVIFRWGRELYGPSAGLLALTLWCFEPTILAFAGVVVPDVPAAAAGVAACYVYWKYLREPSWAGAWFAGLMLGLAMLTKFTWLVLFLVWPALGLLYRVSPPSREQNLRPRAAHGLLIVLASLLVINLGYAFRETGKPLGEFQFISKALGGDPGIGALDDGMPANRFRGTWLEEIPVPVPADMVRGIDIQRRDFESDFPSYLRGEWREGGWWYYYLYAMGVKMPVGVLLLAGAGVLLGLICPVVSSRRDEIALLLPAVAVLALVSSQTGFNHHMHYVLPAFPFLFIAAGKCARLARGRRWAAVLVVGLVLWAVVASLAVAPHFMSYFNELAGGPEHGHEHLLDSNIDWGQDLLFLKSWLAAHPEAEPIGLGYFNAYDPLWMGMNYSLAPLEPNPGYIAVSANFVMGAGYGAPNGQGGFSGIPRGGYSYFRRFTPIAKAGYSIFVYHVTPGEANQVRAEMGLPPLVPEATDP